MGSVYRVRDTELKGALVVLKLLHPELGTDKGLFERFRNEVLLARSLVHPNIARTYDIGRTEDGSYFLTMEYIEGSSLKERIRRTSPGEPRHFESDEIDFAVTILEQLLAGIGHAHDQGIIHRDLKPANVLVTPTGQVKIVDFGTARLLSDNAGLTKTGEIIGTPAYMPPEQIENKAIDHRCDLYATAIIGFELAAGRSPFAADTYIQSLYKQVHEPLPALSTFVSAVPDWYEQAIKKGAAKSGGDRFSSADEFRAALRQTSPRPTNFHAPSRAGNLIWLGLFVCTVLGFGSYLAWLYSPPPELGATKNRQQETVSAKASVEEKGGAIAKDPRPAPIAGPGKSIAGGSSAEGLNVVPAAENIPATPEASLAPARDVGAARPEGATPPIKTALGEKIAPNPPERGTEPKTEAIESLPGKQEQVPTEKADPDDSGNVKSKLKTAEKVAEVADDASRLAPTPEVPKSDSGLRLFLRLPGLSPNDKFLASEAPSLRWIAEVDGDKNEISRLKPILSISQSGNPKKPIVRSEGKLLQASPEVKFGGRVSETTKFAPGDYTAVLELTSPSAEGGAKLSGQSEFTILPD